MINRSYSIELVKEMNKHKIIDTVFFYDEIDTLIFRLTELDEHVDHFIIMESEIDFNGNKKKLFFKENEGLFEQWKNKITYLPTHNLQSNDLDYLHSFLLKLKILNKSITKDLNRHNIQQYQLLTLYNHLLSLDLYMEDLIMISDVDEIPDLSKLSEILDKINFSPVIFRQKNFIWSTDFISTIPHLGTICLQYTNLILNPNYFFNYYFNRTNSRISSFEVVDSGYHLSHFYNIEKTKEKIKLVSPSISDSLIEECWNNLISITSDENNNIYGLVEYLGELPKNINLLHNQPIGRDSPKKHLVCFNLNLESSEVHIDSFKDLIYLINFTENPKEPFNIKISERITQYNILLPQSKYYDILIEDNTLKNFQKMFGVNEVKKILSSDLPISKDLFTFCNGENSDNLLEIPWYELREGFVYDKISEIL